MADFIKDVKEFDHYDTLVIIYKLITDNAFLWSATDRIKDIYVQPTFSYGLFYANSLIDDISLDQDLNDLKDIEDQYSEAKNLACG